MSEAYDLGKMLEEIIDDEKVSSVKNRRISQDEIRKMLIERQKLLSRPKDRERLPLGEALLKDGLITGEQLESALKLKSQKGGKIGSVLVELGYITDEELLKFLARQYGIQSTNLLNLEISESLMSLLPSKFVLKHRVLPIKTEGQTLEVALENPNELTIIHEVEFLTGKRVTPVIIPSYQMDLAIKHIEEKGGGFFSGMEIKSLFKGGHMTIQTLLEQLISSNGSDILVTAGVAPTIRTNTVLKRTGLPSLSPDQCVAYAKALMTERQWETFLSKKELDFAVDYENLGRFRVNVYRQRNTVSIAVRRIMESQLTFEELGLPVWLQDYALRPHGLIIVTAPTGHGKTTSVAAMINAINQTRRCNIISLEDPIEYMHKPNKSNINQREIGADTDSFSEGLRRVFRQAPDVVVIGEMRDHESFEIAVRAASTGHMVLTTMHASSCTAAIDSMVNRFPHHLQADVRQQLSDALLLVFSQRLIPQKGSERMILAYEKLINSYRIKNFIRENKVHQIRTQIQKEAEDFASLDVCLIRLLREGKITSEIALSFAENADFVASSGAH